MGLRRGTVSVEPHRIEWELCAQRTITLLWKLLDDTAADIQHVGSTAVRSIYAKPIIDIALGVTDFDRLLQMNGILDQHGFIYRGQDHPSQHLYVCGNGEIRTHHIHAVIHGSEAWNNYSNLRDYLNAHPNDAQAYSALKQALAIEYCMDRGAYTAAKANFILGILNKTKTWRASFL